MVKNVIHATYTETYDLNTILNELNLLAIHTPQAPALKRMFHGFFENYSKIKVLGCNFRLVCATRQELTPDMIGTGNNQLDARDVLNPILFKACTGENLNALLNQIYNNSEKLLPAGAVTDKASIEQHIDSRSPAVASYYSLLADDSFRREHPQKGITVMGLKPMVHRVVTTQPFKFSSVGSNSLPIGLPAVQPGTGSVGNDRSFGFGGPSGSNTGVDVTNPTVFVSNGLTEMPWLDTATVTAKEYDAQDGSTSEFVSAMRIASSIPRVYMGCLVLPPCIRMPLWYRLQIVWHVAFKDFRPAQDLLPVTTQYPLPYDETGTDVLSNSSDTYFNMYHTANKLQQEFGSFDATGVDSVEQVNEKVN